MIVLDKIVIGLVSLAGVGLMAILVRWIMSLVA